MVLIQTDYRAFRFGAISKYVCCEHCGTDFAYTMIRHAEGHGTSYYFLDEAGAEERANRRAESKVQSALANEVEPVECPKCGRFQADMVQEARRRRWSWLRPFWAVVAPVVLVPMFFCGGMYVNGVVSALPIVPWVSIVYATIALAGLIAVLPLVRFLFSLRYDPNRDTAEQRRARLWHRHPTGGLRTHPGGGRQERANSAGAELMPGSCC